MVIKIEENNFFGIKKENNKWYVIPINDNPTLHDYKIAEIEAKKIGLNLTEDLEIVFEVQLIEKKTFCVNYNYERDNKEIFENDYINYSYMKNENQRCEDPIVESVRQKLLDRSKIGIKKYKTTLKDNTKDNYLNHLQQELLDGVNYIEVLLQQQKDITQLVKHYTNNFDLGKEIRKVYE